MRQKGWYFAGFLLVMLCFHTPGSGQTQMTGVFKDDSLMVMARFNQGRARMVYNLGVTALQNKEHTKALQYFTEATRLDLRMAEAFFNKGIANLLLKNQVEAMLDFAEAIQLDPRPEFYYGRAILLVNRGESASALSDLQRATAVESPGDAAQVLTGQLQLQLKNYAAALEVFTRLNRAEKKNKQAFNGCALAYLFLGDTANAIEQFGFSLEAEPSQPAVLHLLGDLYYRAGKFDDALSAFRNSLVYNTQDAIALNAIAVVFLEKQLTDSAFYYSKLAMNANPGYAPAWNTSGNAFHLTREYQRAEADYSMAISLMPDFWKAYYNRALTREMLRNDQGACDDWKKASDHGINEATISYRENCE